MRILINGAVGSGKTTLARALVDITGTRLKIIEYTGVTEVNPRSEDSYIIVDNTLSLDPRDFDYIYTCVCPKVGPLAFTPKELTNG